MKKIIAFLIAFVMVAGSCLSLCACSSELAADETAGMTEERKTEEKKEAEEKGEIVYPDGLAVGYGRADITPLDAMPIYNGIGESTHDPLLFTCTAVSDGESVALLCSLDMKNITVELTKAFTDRITKEFGIPADHVILGATHTHSTPNAAFGTGPAIKWMGRLVNQSVVAVEAALRDLDLVEGAYTGVGHTEGITFVRRYLMKDGSYETNPSAEVEAHETEADNEMRTIRIDRKNKKDILMVNYQTHYGSATGLYKNQYSADFVHVFREEAEKEWDCHFVYYSGASGNLNFQTKIPGEKKFGSFVEATKEGFIPVVKGCLAGEESVALGKLCFASNWYKAPVYQDGEDAIARAKKVAAQAEGSAAYQQALGENGFTSSRQVEGILTRAELGETVDVPFYAITFGDIGFVSAPYEMFDTNGVQVREGSPFKMTFVCSYANGGFGYVPSAIAFPHGGYEVLVSRFCETTGDDFAAEMVRLLNECKNQ